MLIKGITDTEHFGRIIYNINGENIKMRHFAIRTAVPEHPFKTHKHEQEEFWFVLEGKGIAKDGDEEYQVEPGDLIHIQSRSEHGMTTGSKISFICLG